MLKNKAFFFLIHLLVWSILLLFPIVSIEKTASLLKNDLIKLIVYLCSGIATIGFYYFNYYIAIPNYLFKNKYLLFLLFSIIFVAICIVFTRFLLFSYFINSYNLSHSHPHLLPNYIWRFIFIFIVAFSMRFYQKMKQIEVEQILTELTNLKAQINPHFLFNTLNGIYGLALTKSDKTADYISKLSSMMRYSLLEISAEKVPLENEINYLKNYIELQKIRLTETTIVNFTVEGQIDSQQIPPLLFINFIENSFKYGVSNEVQTEIKIALIVEENAISVYIKNDKVNQNAVPTSHEMGLKNVKRRLNLIFGNNYSLEIQNKQKTFEVNLKIHKIC
jgi:sensor histidine kinase YesM